MSKRKNRHLLQLGSVIKTHRIALGLREETRKFFLDDRVRKGLLEYDDISEKTLMNIENGHNLPNLVTLKILATALEIDFIQLISEIYDHIPRR